MNNEEKILDLLTTLTSDMYIVKTSVSKLEAGQAKLEVTVSNLESNQATMQADITDLKAEVQNTKEILVRFENEYKLDRGGLFDGIDVLQNKADRIESKVDKIESRLDNHELHIRALERPLY